MTHKWQPPYSAASDLCGAMVMRDGGGDECGLPRRHPVHVDASFQAVIDYQREQIRLAFNPLLRPYVAPGYAYSPQEQYVRRLRRFGYGV